jgi:tetratricopeptide (TPR) repeat protein
MRMKKVRLFTLLFFACVQQAKAAFPKSDTDFAFLPPYCKARSSGGDSADYKSWERRLGNDFIHVHHYCAGLHTLNLAFKTRDEAEKKPLYHVALNEMLYVAEHASPGFKLLPKVYYDVGQIFQFMGQIDDAIAANQKSITLYQKTSFPYAALSDLYERKNMKAEAKSILEKGLEHSPNSKILLKRMKKFK